MRVLHTVHAYAPEVGGSEMVVDRLSRGLLDRGHEVEIATKAHPERGDEVEGVPVHGFETDPAGVWRYRRFVHRGVREDRWDVVMTYHSKVWTHLGLAPFNGVSDRWVYCPTEFTDIASARPRHLVYYRTMEPRSLRAAQRVVVLTERDRQRALDIAGEAIRGRIRVVPNGVDTAWWATGEDGDVRARYGLPEVAPLVVYAGGLWEHKDVGTLLEALAKLPDAHLVVTGSERDRRDVIEARMRELGVAERVHLLGRVPREDLRALYHAGTVHASASTNEGFGLTFLEALACGRPVVARPVGVVPELVEAGLPVEVATDADGFAQSIERVLDERPAPDPDALEPYDWERIVDDWIACYEEVLA